MDLAKLLRQQPYACIDTSIGEVCIGGLTAKSQSELRNEIGRSIGSTPPEAFIRALARFVCYPRDKLRDGLVVPDTPNISAEEAARLSVDELNTIASVYVENNEYLFKQREFDREKNDKGETVVVPVYGAICRPRHESESYVQYLQRLLVQDEVDQAERFKKLTQSIPDLSGFSSALSASARNALDWGNSLSAATASLRSVDDPTIRAQPWEPPVVDFIEIAKLQEARRREPFDDLSQRLDRLIKLSADTSTFTVAANEIQTAIAGELKTAADAANRHATHNTRLTWLVIWIALLGLLASGLSTYLGASADRDSAAKIGVVAENVTAQLVAIDDSVRSGSSRNADRLQILLEQLERSNANRVEIDELRETVRRQNERIRQLEVRANGRSTRPRAASDGDAP